MTVNRPNAQRTREILTWLAEHPDPEVKTLAQDMRATFDHQGVPGRTKGKRWFNGALLLAETLMQTSAPVATEAMELAAALEEQNRRNERARCLESGKLIFSSEGAAKKAQGRGRKTDRLRVYLCEFCHGWHLTSRIG